MMSHSQATPTMQRTEHPYIVRVPGVCGGSPIIKETRIAVRHIAQLYKSGETVDDIVQAHPHLSAASVYDAISYYLDHQTDIEREILENRLETLAERHDFNADEQGFVRFDKG